MQVLHGSRALSDFRQKKLIQQLGLQSIEAQYVHFVHTTKDLYAKEQDILTSLLNYGEKFDKATSGTTILIAPRPGTISPWSSKATDIAKNAGLTSIDRIERAVAYYVHSKDDSSYHDIVAAVCDRMTESVLASIDDGKILFEDTKPKPLVHIDILSDKAHLTEANRAFGLALADDEIDYLYEAYRDLNRNPTDAELMMFAQVNSEHCRHKIFNADWVVDGKKQPKSLFKMIRNTYEMKHDGVLSAYSDNAAVIQGHSGGRFFPGKDDTYHYENEPIHSVIKVETHNHPTAIAPLPGAATGSGGEIRDEGATGRGAKPKIGLSGFSVSNLNIPGAIRPWESTQSKPDRSASPLDIMLEAPIGSSSFVNEFGRPNVAGYFRTFEQSAADTKWGYHKPIMLAGGLGSIRGQHVQKQSLKPGSKIIVLGGPSMLIGLGGGAASSMQAGTSSADLDFASVQRGNAEMERRVQEVIDKCWALGAENPIITIHDVGAGGLSNALPEFVHDSGLGATYELRDVPSAESGLSPLETWCNESQERYVVGIDEKDLASFSELCERERCPFAVVGQATAKTQLVVTDRLLGEPTVDLPMDVLFGKPPKMTRRYQAHQAIHKSFDTSRIDITDAVERVLQLPSVGSKKFLITIGDRNVGGLTMRDQMIGKWQVPVSDVAVSATSFDSHHGEAMTIGERSPVAIIDAPASARLAIGETITNIMASDIRALSDMKLSANWMAAVGVGHEDQALYETVKAVGETFCPALGLTIPVGKDSLSMRTAWDDQSVVSPVSLIISGFSPVEDISKTLTPELKIASGSELVFVDLSGGKARLGGSALAQVYNQVGDEAPDADSEILRHFCDTLRSLKDEKKILAYHDRSDGGLFTTLVEMAIATRAGLDIDLTSLSGASPLEVLFNEELGVVLQSENAKEVQSRFQGAGVEAYMIGTVDQSEKIRFHSEKNIVYENSREKLELLWSDTSYQIQRIRDNAELADEERALISEKTGGLTPIYSFELLKKRYKTRPKIAVIRDQGVNGQVEMAAAFDAAGFMAVDVHLTDLIKGRKNLSEFSGLVACGGFSYGDVLGAGEGWAKTILADKNLRQMFAEFFERIDTFSLGVCNGCQMLSALKEIIHGAEHWPTFLKNKSEQFEARLALVKITASPSILLKGMEGSVLPIPVAHGEGRAVFASNAELKKAQISLQYVDDKHDIAVTYPMNPNGSLDGITGLTSTDGRVTIMMPHPERAFQTRQLSWHPKEWEDEASPWLRMFQNARQWVESN